MSSDHIGHFKRFRDLLKRKFCNNSRLFYFNDREWEQKFQKFDLFYGKCGYNIQKTIRINLAYFWLFLT